MNNEKPRLRAYTCAVLAFCVFAAPLQAADRPSKFVVSNDQMKAYGIQTAPLKQEADLVRARFHAQVVIPPNAEQVLSSPVPGLVSQLLVQQNDAVRKGAPLIRITSSELGQLQLQFLQAGARATLARQSARREQQLFKEGIIPQRRVQEAQADLKEAEAALQQTRAALRLSGMSTISIDRVAASGNLDDSITLASMEDGTITRVAVTTGQRVDSASPLLHLAQTEVLWLNIQAPVADSANWRPGTEVKVLGRDTMARILSVSPSVSVESQTVVLRALIEGNADQVRPGEFVTVEIPVAAAVGSWELPLSAITHDGNQAYVFVRTSEGFEARPVKVTASAGQRMRVNGPISAGEQVAISGVVALKGAWLDDPESP